MTLPASGAISFNAINVELCRAGGAQLSLNDSAVRTLFGQASGAVCMDSGHGKSNTSVPGAPTSVSASATSCSAISVSFSAPASNGGLTIDYYQVVCTSSGSNSATGASSPISVTGLSASTSYTFKVRAHNSKGYGCYSSSTGTATTQSPPYMCISTYGATVYTCGNFKIAVWTGSGSYTVNRLGSTTNFGTNISALTISGGGGTGSLLGGGGGGSGSSLMNCCTGAGGLTVTTGLKSVTVGAGGAQNGRSGLGGNGCQTNMKYTSTCTTFGTSAGTGGIQSNNNYGGTSGNGYGGGASYISCQSKYSDRENGGGGGGANGYAYQGYGGTANSSSAGNGGTGLSVPSQFSYYYSNLTGLSSSGGGGGGSSIYYNVPGFNSGGCAGSGGGGVGSRWNNFNISRYGTAGTPYSGGGAGACYTNSGRNGGSGVAMIRWRFQ